MSVKRYTREELGLQKVSLPFVKRPELLMPAGNVETFNTGLKYGADAIYIGGEMYSLRAKATNFSKEEMKECIKKAKSLGKKVYVTANITAHNNDLQGIRDYFTELHNFNDDEKPNALIISDPGVFMLAKELCPEIERHISTQANNVNYSTCKFWYDLGATRVVTGRELSLEEIAEIKRNIPNDLEVECFIHGAMCISYSGRCLLSNYFTGRDANLGACTHPCRWKYYVSEKSSDGPSENDFLYIEEEKRKGEFLPVYENDRGTYIFNSKDLCMIKYVDKMIEAGIDSFKIEGRMKTALYVATVARAYRMAIDDFFENPLLYEANIPFYEAELFKCTYRQYTTGFYFGKPNEEAQIYDNNVYERNAVYYGFPYAIENNRALMEQKNKFYVGEEVEILKADGSSVYSVVESIQNEEGEEMDSCPHAKQKISVRFSKKPDVGDIIRSLTTD
ncbi:MAG: U32 family peptidase C-terminal domain-containing protein [Lachnospiraceae bacterium]|nr:U32 family peptidase C-terminal domain-containing protein [Lachnospiraceae bacterium]